MSIRLLKRAVVALLAGISLAWSPAHLLAQGGEEVQAHVVKIREGKKWVGVGGGTIPDILRAHLDIPDDEGVLVVHVAVDSPAERAGLKQHDVLLSVDGKPIRTLRDLADAVEAAGHEGLELEWSRKGRVRAETVHPEARPLRRRGGRLGPSPGVPWHESFRAPFRMRLFGPGVAIDDKPIPSDLSIEIRKQGAEPAQIVVEREGEKWEVNENDLGSLPPEIRKHVQRYLGKHMDVRSLFSDHLDEEGEITLRRPDEFAVPWMERFGPAPDIEDRLDKMNERIDELFEELRRLRIKVAVPRDEEKL